MILFEKWLSRLLMPSWSYCSCEPTTLLAASLALSAATTGLSLNAQNNAAKAQAHQQQELVAANNSVAAEQMSAVRVQEAQQQEATARENEKARLANKRASSSAYVASGEAGVTGHSVDALLQEYSANLGQFREATNRQAQFNKQGNNAQVESIRTGARYQNLQINAPVTGANYAAEGVRLAGSSISAIRAYRQDTQGTGARK